MEIDELVERVVAESDWNARIALIRRVPEFFGNSLHRDAYARIADRAYVSHLAPDFAFIHWREEYGLPVVEKSYELAKSLTCGFLVTDLESLTQALHQEPSTLLVFRLLMGFTASELAAATGMAENESDAAKALNASTIKNIEAGSACSKEVARRLAAVIDAVFRGTLFPAPASEVLRPKLEKPDTREGWISVRRYAEDGVPLGARQGSCRLV